MNLVILLRINALDKELHLNFNILFQVIKYIIYAYYEKNNLYKNNFKYFLDNAILNNID
jgi:hypothetical protein